MKEQKAMVKKFAPSILRICNFLSEKRYICKNILAIPKEKIKFT